MRYQLEKPLRTDKYESLPKDLKALADEVLAKKFGLAEVIKKKKVEPKPNPVQPPEEPPSYRQRGMYDAGFHMVTISAMSDKVGIKPMDPMQWMISGRDEDMNRTIDMSRENVWYRRSLALDYGIAGYDAMKIISRSIHELIDDIRREGWRPVGSFELSIDGHRYPVRDQRDIEKFVMRELRNARYNRY